MKKLKTGDKVVVVSGSNKGKEGKISRVSLSSQRISPRLAAAAQKDGMPLTMRASNPRRLRILCI